MQMPAELKTKTDKLPGNKISGSNSIAYSYNSAVKAYFLKTVKPCEMMCLYGGIGLDLQWLTTSNFYVLFCEPSERMREIARANVEQLQLRQQVSLVDGKKTDFHIWSQINPPCDEVDAVLANDTILNNIADINLLFEKLALIMNDGAHFIATVLNYSFFSLFKFERSIAFKSLFNTEPLEVNVKSSTIHQPLFIYSDNHLRKAYSNYFKLIMDKPIPNSGVRLIHLQKFT